MIFIESVPRTVFNSNFSLMHGSRDVSSFEILETFLENGFKNKSSTRFKYQFSLKKIQDETIVKLTCLDSLKRLDTALESG